MVLILLSQQYERLPQETKDNIEDFFNLRDLRCLSQVSRVFRELAQGMLRRRVIRILRAFALPYEDTLHMLRRRNAAISGSGAVAAVNPGYWTPGDLDFYCPKWEAEPVIRYFRSQDYEHLPTNAISTQPQTPRPNHGVQYGSNHGIRQVYNLQNRVTGRRIQVIESMSLCPLVPVFFFHSTVVMNFITGTGAFCCYPSWTLRHRGLLNVQLNPAFPCLPPATQSSLTKYEERGYTFEDRLDEGDPTAHAMPGHPDAQLPRSWYDHESLCMPFIGDEDPWLRPTFGWHLARRSEYSWGIKQNDAIVVVQGEEGDTYYTDCEGRHHIHLPSPNYTRVY